MKTIRRLYFYLVAFISMEIVLWGLIGLARSIFSDSVGGGWPNLPLAPFIISAHHPASNKLVCQKNNSDRLTVIDLGTGEKTEVPNGFKKKLVTDLNPSRPSSG